MGRAVGGAWVHALPIVGPSPGRAQQQTRSAGFWGLSTEDSQAAISCLNDTTPATGPDTPWAAVSLRPDGGISATASTLFFSGLYWSIEDRPQGPCLIVSDSPSRIVEERFTGTSLDDEYLRSLLLLRPAAEGSPYREIRRIRPGTTAAWRPGDRDPSISEWCGPSTWLTPHLEGPETVGAYRRVFDATVDRLVDQDAPLVATMSSGLDSTFVVSSLVRHATKANPVHAFCHSPIPETRLSPGMRGVLDEYPIARAMERKYPGLVIVHRVVNEQRRLALDAARDFAAETMLPAINGANQVWVQEISKRARALGAGRIFHGSTGNAGFSHPTEYAGAYYAGRGDFLRLWTILGDHRRSGRRLGDGLRTQLLGPAVRSVRGRRADGTSINYARVVGIPDDGPGQAWTGNDRSAYLAMLSMDSGFAGSLVPLRSSPASIDPFRGREVLDLAADVTPAEWRRGPYNRGFARRAMAGRVPDEIRLRTTRGLQSMDAWHVMREARDRYSEELQKLPQSPVFGDWIDPAIPTAIVESWPWGRTTPPNRFELDAIDSLLALASFSRFASARLSGGSTKA